MPLTLTGSTSELLPSTKKLIEKINRKVKRRNIINKILNKK